MSIAIMSAVWANGPEDKAELLVLLALADFADDRGVCWPSMASVGRKARMSERNARRVIRSLEDAGYLTTDEGGGRHGCSQYRINSDKVSAGQNVRPGQSQPETRTKRAQNPDIAMSAEPSRTIIEPSEISKTREIASVIEAWASPQSVASFLAYRRKSKGKALTLTGAKRLAGNLRAIFNANGDPDDALGMAEERGWLTVEPDWYFRAKGNGNGTSSQSAPRRSGMVDAFAAVAAQRSGHS
jgi:hypothetical protein